MLREVWLKIPFSFPSYLGMPSFLFSSTFSLIIGREVFSTGLSSDLWTLQLAQTMALTLTWSTTCCRKSFRTIQEFQKHFVRRPMIQVITVCHLTGLWLIQQRGNSVLWRVTKFPVILNMCFYHYLINWAPIDIINVEYEIPSGRKVPHF